MIHIDKNLDDAPQSLLPATTDFFTEIPTEAEKTHRIRLNMAAGRKYDKSADNRYKADDVKEKLEALYHNKCAYCEQYIEQYHVEHYRPKRGRQAKDTPYYRQHEGYPWLSLSWDNLLLACPVCNEKKGNKFDILAEGTPALSIPQSDVEWKDIHNLSAQYDDIEKPLLLNPERCNPEEHLDFCRDGSIVSLSQYGEYTIKVCDLNRKNLKDQRRRIVDKLVRKFIGILAKKRDEESTKEKMCEAVQDFINEAYDVEEPFLLFRRKMVEIERLRSLEAEAQSEMPKRYDIQ